MQESTEKSEISRLSLRATRMTNSLPSENNMGLTGHPATTTLRTTIIGLLLACAAGFANLGR